MEQKAPLELAGVKPAVHIEEASQSFPGSRRALGLLLDIYQIKRSFKGQIPEGEPDVSYDDPCPAQAQSQDQQEKISYGQ
jgi:hypothetical protein